MNEEQQHLDPLQTAVQPQHGHAVVVGLVAGVRVLVVQMHVLPGRLAVVDPNDLR